MLRTIVIVVVSISASAITYCDAANVNMYANANANANNLSSALYNQAKTTVPINSSNIIPLPNFPSSSSSSSSSSIQINQLMKEVSVRGNKLFSTINQQSSRIKVGQVQNKIKNVKNMNMNIDISQLKNKFKLPQLPPLQMKVPLPPKILELQKRSLSLSSLPFSIALSGLRSNVESNMMQNIEHIENIQLPFKGRGGSTVTLNSLRLRKRSRSKSTTTTKNVSTRTKRRRNNTGFYYGIQDDVFFDSRENQDGDTSSNQQQQRQQQEQQQQRQQQQGGVSSFQQRQDNDTPYNSEIRKEQKESISSSALGDIMGETLLELREMREDIMALREEMHYMKEEMRRSNPSNTDYEEEEEEYGETGEGDSLGYDNEDKMKQRRIGSLAESVIRKQEFDEISKDVEKWAHKLLFEEDGEENGWKEVICNKMVRKKFNRDGTTKCYIKWMKDSRKIGGSSSTQAISDNEDTEYPCIKCYSTINSPIEKVCDYLSQESNMAEYNDLVIAYKDLEGITPQSKICWSQCPQILFIKPRDFVTFCHHRWRKDGTQIVVNQACEHEDAPGNAEEGDGKICRAHALRGANFISRDPNDPNKTRMAILAHANPGGGVPQWAMKTAVNAVAPIEPFKLFHRIDSKVSAADISIDDPMTNMVNSVPGQKSRPAGLSQLGYACFWPSTAKSSIDYNAAQRAQPHSEYTNNEYLREDDNQDEERGVDNLCIKASSNN